MELPKQRLARALFAVIKRKRGDAEETNKRVEFSDAVLKRSSSEHPTKVSFERKDSAGSLRCPVLTITELTNPIATFTYME